MRVFAAVLLPTPVLNHLELALGSVRAASDPDDTRGPLRWTAQDQRHLTLAFYGEVPDGAVDDLVTDLVGVAATTDPFELSLRGAGVFDRRTLWVGCAGETAEMAALAAAAVGVGRDVVGRGDARARSRAHATVARVRSQERGRQQGRAAGEGGGAREVAALAHALAVYQGPSWRVEDVAVVASRLGAGPGGHPHHETLALLPLRPVAG